MGAAGSCSCLAACAVIIQFAPAAQSGNDKTPQIQKGKTALPARFWIFAAFVLLYGDLRNDERELGVSLHERSLGASTTRLLGPNLLGYCNAGRMLFAAIGRWFPEHRTYRMLPFVVATALIAVAYIPQGDPLLGILAFGLAGLGCSALLPLTISFGQKELTAIAARFRAA